MAATNQVASGLATAMANAVMERNPQGWMLDFSTKPTWNYCHGLVCSALAQAWQHTGNERYYQYIRQYADDMIEADGTIKTYRLESYNIDKVNSGKFLFPLYAHTHEDKYKKAIAILRQQMVTHPRTSEGGFWHKQVYPHQMWLDGLYMGAPFLAQYAVVFHEPDLLNDVAKQFMLIDQHLYHAEKGLYYHGWDEQRAQPWADKQTGLSANFWGRGMGWYAMALVDALDFFPKDHPHRQDLLRITEKVAQGIARYQDPATGLWYQVLDQGGREGNYLESSASVMFVYFLTKALQQGYINPSYTGVAEAGYAGVLAYFIRRSSQGLLEITDACAGAGLGGNPYRSGDYDYYIHEAKRDNDPKAVGPFIMLTLLKDQGQP